MQRCNFSTLRPLPLRVFSKGNHPPSLVNFRRAGRESDAFLSSLEIDRSRCGAMHSGVVSFSSDLFQFSLPWNETNRVSRSPPFNPPFFCFISFITLHSYHSGATTLQIGLWSSPVLLPASTWKGLRNRWIMNICTYIFEQRICTRLACSYILDIQITH